MGTDNTKMVLLKPESMTIYEALEVQEMFANALKEYQVIEVDLSQVIEIDSAGIQLMVALKNDALEQNKIMTFTGHSREVIGLLDLFNMNAFFGDPVVL